MVASADADNNAVAMLVGAHAAMSWQSLRCTRLDRVADRET